MLEFNYDIQMTSVIPIIASIVVKIFSYLNSAM